jgi:protein-S-isoprenylcysteine O-methyltransferase Ste14
LTDNDVLPRARARSEPRAGSPSSERDIPGVIAPPPLLYIIGLAIGFGLDAALPSASLSRAVAWLAGGALLVAGLLLAASFFAAFRRARTPVDVRKPTSAVVTSGPYRLSRNPGYLSLALIYAGIAILTSSLWAFVSLIPTLLLVEYGVIRREERYLERKFGEEYRRYKARTRRWV